MRKIKAAETETTAPADDMAESATTMANKPTRGGNRDGIVQAAAGPPNSRRCIR